MLLGLDGDLAAQLNRIERLLQKLVRSSFDEVERDQMAQADIDRLRAEVAKNTDTTNSAVTLINGLATQIRDLADDPAALQELATQLEASSAKLAEAVTANVPPQSPSPAQQRR